MLSYAIIISSLVCGTPDECNPSPKDCSGHLVGWQILPYVTDGKTQENLWGNAPAWNDQIVWKMHIFNLGSPNSGYCDVSGESLIYMLLEEEQFVFDPGFINLPLSTSLTFDLHSHTMPHIADLYLAGYFLGESAQCPPEEFDLEFLTPRWITNPADVTRDLRINTLDIFELLEQWGTNDLRADVDNDGIVGVLDLINVVQNYGWMHEIVE